MSADDEKISSLYNDAGKPGPSPALDDAILSASRKAVAKPARTGPFSGAWPAFASVAAIIVVAIVLVPLIRQEPPAHKMEAPTADKQAGAELAEQEPLDLYSNAESRKSDQATSLPAIEPVIDLEHDVAEERQAIPGASFSDLPVMRSRSPALGKASTPAGVAPAGDSAADSGSRSRMTAADSAPFAILTPEMWETRITQLLDEGQIELAKAELDKLQQHFPGHEVTRELLARFTQLEAN